MKKIILNKRLKNSIGAQQLTKGISLIVLIITIIIIIILAGAIILSLSNNNPIESANKAKFLSDVSTYRADLALNILNKYSESMGTFNSKTISATGDNLKKYISSMKETDKTKFEIKAGQLLLTANANDNEKLWFGDNADPIVPEVATGGDIGLSTEATNIKSRSTFKTPYIPAGFKYVTGTYDTGVVIEDIGSTDVRRGSQFTWVPVQKFADFKRTDFAKRGIMNVKTTYEGEAIYNGVDTDGSELSNIYKSVKTYGGFYIARYESSNESGIAVSKAGKNIWTNIPWGTNNKEDRLVNPGTTGAVVAARALYTDKLDIASNLVYGAQWDTTLKFIETKVPGYATNSNGKGNYVSQIKTTGSNIAYMTNNISDMAGNVSEWTMEGNDSSIVYHGGDYGDRGDNFPAGGRYTDVISCTWGNYVGFRTSVYIK